jgi:hypothetical protein
VTTSLRFDGSSVVITIVPGSATILVNFIMHREDHEH